MKNLTICGMPYEEYQKLKYNTLAKKLKESKDFVAFSEVTEEEQKLIDIDDRIDSYLKGKMTTEEELQFIKDCKEDKELKEKACMTALLVKALNSNIK